MANSTASATNVAISFPALASSTNYLALLAKSANPVKHSTGLNWSAYWVNAEIVKRERINKTAFILIFEKY